MYVTEMESNAIPFYQNTFRQFPEPSFGLNEAIECIVLSAHSKRAAAAAGHLIFVAAIEKATTERGIPTQESKILLCAHFVWILLSTNTSVLRSRRSNSFDESKKKK